MKYYILLLPAFVFFFNAPRSPYSKNYPGYTSDSLVPFHLILYDGDEAVQKYEINVFSKSNKYYAENISPLHYESSDSFWTVELDNDKIQACIKFINKAKTLPKECEETSSVMEDYTIAVHTDTIKIRGNCDWGDFGFFSLRDILFKERFSEEELRRRTEVFTLNKKLKGKWYFAPLQKELKYGDYLILTRSNDLHSECFWEFGNNDSFKASCNKIPNFAFSKKYEWHLNGYNFLEILAGTNTNNKGDMSIENYGATFILDTLNDKKLRLIFLSK